MSADRQIGDCPRFLLVAEDPEAVIGVDLEVRKELWACPITLGEFCFVHGAPQPAGQNLVIIASSGSDCHFVAAIGSHASGSRLERAPA